MRTIISKERDKIDQDNKVINIVLGVFSDIEIKISNDRTSQENENQMMITEVRDFAFKINNKPYLLHSAQNSFISSNKAAKFLSAFKSLVLIFSIFGILSKNAISLS